MPTVIQRSFSGGEVTPSLYPRVDLTKYQTGLKTARNGFVHRSGGFSNRPGSFYIHTLPGTDYRFIQFQPTDTADGYILVVDPTRIQFIQNGVLLTVDTPPAAWANVTNYIVGDLVEHGGVYYYCVVDHLSALGVNDPPNISYWLALEFDAVKGWIYSIPSYIQVSELPLFRFVQDFDTIVIAHESTRPINIVRVDHLNWTIKPWSNQAGPVFGPGYYGLPLIGIPTITFITSPGAVANYVVTSIAKNTYEESLPSASAGSGLTPNPGTPVTIIWSAVTDALGYNIYVKYYGQFKLIGFTEDLQFVDAGITPSADADNVPRARVDEFYETIIPTLNVPSAVGSYQQRIVLANFTVDKAAYYLSRINNKENFTYKFPTVADDSIAARIRGRGSNAIKHILDIGALVIFTNSGEWIVGGDTSGVITPPVTQQQFSYNGSSDVAPVVAGTDAIYVQERGSILRALGFDIQSGGKNGYRDDDLTVFATHLVKNKTINSIAYQQTPDSVIWCSLTDGSFLAVTYNRSQQVLAWSKHDTLGEVQELVSIQEGTEHALYARIKRTINGSEVMMLERFHTRNFTDIVDAVFLDSSLTYDGRNTTATTMTVSGGTAWDDTETQTMTASAGFFVIGDVGNAIHLTDANGATVIFTIEGYTSPTVVTVRPDKLVPVAMRSTALLTWAKAVDTVSGLGHLEGEEVGVFADGYVVASPNNPEYGTPLVVSSGSITLDRPYAVIHVGLPYISDLETLDIDTLNGETLIDKRINISRVSAHVEDTRGLFAGGRVPSDDSVDPLEGLVELKVRDEENYGDPIALKTGVVDVIIESNWSNRGRVLIRQVDPLPMSILSIAPAGMIPFRG